MPKFETTQRMPHSAEQMFAIVADIEKYPQFVPLCEALNVIERYEEANRDIIEADMTVAYKAIRETFRSKVELDQQNLLVSSQSMDGPFKHLFSEWKFLPLCDTMCDVQYQINYEFKNWIFQKLMGGLFEKAISTYSTSFENRATVLKRNLES